MRLHAVSILLEAKHSKLDKKCSSMSSGNPFILGSKGQHQGHDSKNHGWHGSLHSCACWILLVIMKFS